MKLLLIQYRPAIRLYKWATTLKSEGHRITIGCTQTPVAGLNWGKFDMHDISGNYDFDVYDYIISFNPNLNISHPTDKVPVIQAVGDLVSTYKNVPLERMYLNKAHKVVFISELQKRWAVKNLETYENKCSVVLNGLIPEISTAKLPKIRNGKINLVYEGTTTDLEGHNRNIIEHLRRLAAIPNVTVTVYPSSLGIAEAYKSIGVDVRTMVSPYQIVTELSQYDAGLILMNNSEIGRMAMPNKLFEYVGAGLPVITHPYMGSIAQWNEGKGIVSFDLEKIELPKTRNIQQFAVHYENLTKIFTN